MNEPLETPPNAEAASSPTETTATPNTEAASSPAETTATPDPASAGAATLAADLLEELRARLGDGADLSAVGTLLPALSRLADSLIIVACDRLARGDMAAFYETVLDGMTEAERTAWRCQVTAAWHAAAQERWQEREDLRRTLLETLLFVKALALA